MMGGSSGSSNVNTVQPNGMGGLSNSGGSSGSGSGGSMGGGGMGTQDYGVMTSTGLPPYSLQQGNVGYNPNNSSWYQQAGVPSQWNGMNAYTSATGVNNALGAGNWSYQNPYTSGGGPINGYVFGGFPGQSVPAATNGQGPFNEVPVYNPNVQGSNWAAPGTSAYGMTPNGAPGGPGSNPNSNYSKAAVISGGGQQGGGYSPRPTGGAGVQSTMGSSAGSPSNINFLMQQILAGGGGGLGGFGLNGRPIGT